MKYDELTEKSNFEWQHGTFPLPQDGAGFTSDDDDDDDTIDDNRDSDSGSQEQGHAGGEKRTQRRNVIKMTAEHLSSTNTAKTSQKWQAKAASTPWWAERTKLSASHKF